MRNKVVTVLLVLIAIGLQVLVLKNAHTQAKTAASISELQERVNLLSSELQAALGEKDKAEAMAEKALFEAADMRQKLEEATQKITQLEKELDNMRIQNSELVRRIEALRKNVEVSIIRHASSSKARVAITIDDGWDPSMVKQAVEILQEKKAKATFFVVGKMLPLSSQAIKEAVRYGIEMGNHTTTHAHLTSLDEQGISVEIQGWEKAMQEILGEPYQTAFFRPPGMTGFTSQSQTEKFGRIIAGYGYKIALWSVDTYWGVYKEKGFNVSPQEVANYVIQNSRGGSIILLHFIESDIRALPFIIDGLRQKGLELVTLSELTS